MALPRYDLHGDPTTWFDNIKQSETGAWYRAKDVQPLLDQFVAMGGVIPDALYPEGEAYGARGVVGYTEQPPQPHSQGGKLPDYEPPSIDTVEEELSGGSDNDGDTRDSEEGTRG